MNVNVVIVDDHEENLVHVFDALQKLGVVSIESPFTLLRTDIEIRPQVRKVLAKPVERPSPAGTETRSDMEKQACDLEKWAGEVAAHNPGVAVVDMRLYDGNLDDSSGVDLALRIKDRHPDCCVILMSAHFRQLRELPEFRNLEILRGWVELSGTPEENELPLFDAVRTALRTHATNVLYRARKFERTVAHKPDMWALVLDPATRSLEFRRSVPVPYLRSNSVVVQLLQAGVCGTNHASLGTLRPPSTFPKFELIDLHEAFGEVVWTGESVRGLHVGDFVVPMVRRCDTWDRPAGGTPVGAGSFDFRPCEGDGDCTRQPDECSTTEYDVPVAGHRVGYKSRGTGKCHGFASEYFVDTADWLVKVELPRVHQPEDELERKRITNRCVLAEPLSIVWKARREILKHHTIHECKDKVLIVGAGPIGLLAGVVMKNLHPGLEYTVVDLAEPTNIRAQFVQDLGLEYLQAPGEHAVPAKIAARKFDILIEATDRPHDVFAAYSGLLKGGGVFMMIGIPEGDSGVTIQPALFNQFVKNRNVLIGSINSNRSDFEESIAFLRRVVSGPHPVLDRMITMVPVDDNTGSKLTTFGAEPRNARTYVKLVVEPK